VTLLKIKTAAILLQFLPACLTKTPTIYAIHAGFRSQPHLPIYAIDSPDSISRWNEANIDVARQTLGKGLLNRFVQIANAIPLDAVICNKFGSIFKEWP
jgi:hypothetical protein